MTSDPRYVWKKTCSTKISNPSGLSYSKYKGYVKLQVGYPVDAQQRMPQQHRDFKAYARLRVLEFRTGDRSSLGSPPGFMRMWLVEHEFGLDRELVGWIRGHLDDQVAAPR